MKAICLMMNCNRIAPADEAMCSKHRLTESEESTYQRFKARLIKELVVDVHGTSHYGRLLTKEISGT